MRSPPVEVHLVFERCPAQKILARKKGPTGASPFESPSEGELYSNKNIPPLPEMQVPLQRRIPLHAHPPPHLFLLRPVGLLLLLEVTVDHLEGVGVRGLWLGVPVVLENLAPMLPLLLAGCEEFLRGVHVPHPLPFQRARDVAALSDAGHQCAKGDTAQGSVTRLHHIGRLSI